MQEPPSSSAPPPYSQIPYAAPPPPRRSGGFMMYCLGCMGLVAIVALVAVVVGYFSVRKAMAPVTAANVQTLLPPGVPLHPDLSPVLEQQSRSIQMPSKEGTRRMVVLAFHTPDEMSVIGPWYQERLTRDGWVGGVSATDANVYQFKKGDTAMSLTERTDGEGKRLLTMSIVEGLPLGSVGTPGTP